MGKRKYRRVGPLVTPKVITKLSDIPHAARPFISKQLFEAARKPKGWASKKAKDTRAAYVGEAYNLDLDRPSEREAAGKRSAFRATVLHSENWGRSHFKRVSGRGRGKRPLYRYKSGPKKGQYVGVQKVKQAIRDRRRREEIKLMRKMHDMTAKEASKLRTKNRAEFDFLLTWGQYDRGDIKKGKVR